MKIGFGCDHAGFKYKSKVIEFIKSLNYNVMDFGCFSEASCDYPDFAKAVAESVSNGDCQRGILICGSGIGMSITANKFLGIRAALCWNEEIAKLSREHNDSNIICLPSRFVSDKDIIRMIEIWLKVPYDINSRHQKRINKIIELEEKLCKK